MTSRNEPGPTVTEVGFFRRMPAGGTANTAPSTPDRETEIRPSVHAAMARHATFSPHHGSVIKLADAVTVAAAREAALQARIGHAYDELKKILALFDVTPEDLDVCETADFVSEKVTQLREELDVQREVAQAAVTAIAAGDTTEAGPIPPKPLDGTGRWIFRGHDQLGDDVWSWDPTGLESA